MNILFLAHATAAAAGLPTDDLTLHVDASDADNLFTTFDSGGTHTGTPGDGDTVQAWDDEAGIADVAVLYEAGGAFEPPTYRVNSPLMPLPCLDFDGSNDGFKVQDQDGGADKAASELITNSAFTILLSFFAESITTTAANPYENHILIGDTGGHWGIALKDDSGTLKVLAFNYDGSYDEVALTVTTGEAHVVMVRHEGGSLYISLDGGSESSVTSGNTTVVTSAIAIGTRGTGSTYLNGRIGELAVYNVALTGTDLSNGITYFTDKWLVESHIATATLTAGAATLSASAQHDVPEYDADAALTAGAATLSAEATHEARTYDADATLAAGAATLSASGEHDAPGNDGDATLTAGAATLSASGAFEVKTYGAVATLVAAAVTLSATGAVTDPDVPVVVPGQRTFAPDSRRYPRLRDTTGSYRGLDNRSSRYRTLR